MSTLKERLLANSVLMNGPLDTPCRIFAGAKSDKGYGLIYDKGLILRAHIVSYKLHIGPVPKGLFVLHHCDNPPCINPEHLWLGTAQDNSYDMMNKDRNQRQSQCGELNGRAKLTRQKAAEIKWLALEKKLSQREIGLQYNISQTLVSQICYNQRWTGLSPIKPEAL